MTDIFSIMPRNDKHKKKINIKQGPLTSEMLKENLGKINETMRNKNGNELFNDKQIHEESNF